MSRHARGLRRRTGNGRARKAASADRLRAEIEGSGGGEQAKIAMSRQGRGLRRRTDGRAGKAIPPQSGVTACIFETVQNRNVVAT